MRSPGPNGFSDSRSLEQSMLLDEGVKGLGDHWRQCFPEIVGPGKAMTNVLETVSKVARSDGSVLILGESGTGKDLIASAIHRLSHRSHKAYVPLNCSAIPDTLLESELFGHERGSFTGADRRHMGKFQYAEGGTIFLDEIGDMPALLQAKLLRVLQDKKFAPLGSNVMLEADVRVVAATNMNLEAAMKQNSFRRDLFYRLNVLPIHLPPLRERSDDVPHLLAHFLAATNRVHAMATPCYFTDALIKLLSVYSWPGNIRQLENLVERLVVMKGGGGIDVGDLPDEMFENGEIATIKAPTLGQGLGLGEPFAPKAAVTQRPTFDSSGLSGRAHIQSPEDFGRLPESGLDLAGFIESLENDLIRQALERTGNNRNQAAKLLGLNRTTLVERIKKRRLTTLNEPSKEL